jgi:hypothetical protein
MKKVKSVFLVLLFLLLTSVLAIPAQATLIDLGPGGVTPLASVITFDEVPLYTVNPVYNFTGLPGLGNVTVSFGGYFVGQAAGGGYPVTLTDTTPTGPLALDVNAPNTVTVYDGAPGATSPVLSGTPTFNGPISVLFSVPVAGVGLKGGYFDALNSTTIEAYDGNGISLGSITNTVTGFEFYGLVDSSGTNAISGISFYITGNEPAGFEIDNLTFGSGSAFNPIPEPGTMLLVGTGLVGLAGFRRRFKN